MVGGIAPCPPPYPKTRPAWPSSGAERAAITAVLTPGTARDRHRDSIVGECRNPKNAPDDRTSACVKSRFFFFYQNIVSEKLVEIERLENNEKSENNILLMRKNSKTVSVSNETGRLPIRVVENSLGNLRR